MINYFGVPNGLIINKSLSIDMLLKQCDKSLQSIFQENIMQCSVYSIFRRTTSVNPYLDELIIINLEVNRFDNIQKIVIIILKAIRYQTIICVHLGDKVCFFSGEVRPQKLRSYEFKVVSIFRSRLYSTTNNDLQNYNKAFTFSSSPLEVLYKKVSAAFASSSSDTLSSSFVGQLYTYACEKKADFLQYHDFVRECCESIEVILDNGAIKTVHTYQQVFDFLQRVNAFLPGEDLIEVISYFFNHAENFNLELPDSLQQKVDEYDDVFWEAMDNISVNEEEPSCYEEFEDFGEDYYSFEDDLFYLS